MKKEAVAILGILLLINCFGSDTVKRYFQLQLPNKMASDLEQIHKVLFVDAVVAEDLYDDFRVIYRKSPYQINYYAYDFWVKKPAVLLRNTMIQFFSELETFDQVSDTLSQIKPDIILKSRLNAIEELDSGSRWFARLSMELNFSDFKSGQSLYTYRFDRKKVLPERDVVQIPRIISDILYQELSVSIRHLQQKIKAFGISQSD